MRLENIQLNTDDFYVGVSEDGQCGHVSWEIENSDARFTLRLRSEGESVLRHVSASFDFPL